MFKKFRQKKIGKIVCAYDFGSYVCGLNDLLSANGFSEQFAIEKDSWKGVEFDKLVLRNCGQEQTIEIIANGTYGEVVFYYLNNHDHINFYNDFKDNLMEVFEHTKAILENRVVVFSSKNRGGSCALDLDINSFNYTENEKRYLANSNMAFEVWSGKVTENMKLFVVGSVFTNMPEIQGKHMEKYYGEQPCSQTK